jgi:hypothetical protein
MKETNEEIITILFIYKEKGRQKQNVNVHAAFFGLQISARARRGQRI